MHIPLLQIPQPEKFPEECKNYIFAWANGERRRCRNTISALRDSRKTVSGENFSICWDSAVKNIWQYLKILLDLSENLQIKMICHSPFTDSAARKVPGGVQKLYFCMEWTETATVQKYNFCTPGQPQNRIRGKLFDLLGFKHKETAMTYDFSALKIPELTVDQNALFGPRANPHFVSVLLDEFDKEKSPFYSGLKPFEVPEQDKKEIYKALGDHLLSEYEKNRQNDEKDRQRWKHSEQREVVETAIRFYLRISGEKKFPDLELQMGKAYLHRSRIIKPKGFTIPAKKEESLKKARKCFQDSSSALAVHYEAVTGLEMDRCDLISENELSEKKLTELLRKAAKNDVSGYEVQQKIEYLQICVRLEELNRGEFGAKLQEICKRLPEDKAELEKLKVMLYTGIEKMKGKDISSCRNDLLERLKKAPLSHPLWEDTVRFLRHLYRMRKNESVERISSFWPKFALALWECAEDISRQISSLHLRWYWSRQRDLYDLAFLAALENKDFHKAAEIADSAKNRPALTWQAMEKMGESKDKAGKQLKECIEQYAIALSGGYIDMKKGKNPCMAQETEKPEIPPKTDGNTIIVQFYLVHLKADEKMDHPNDKERGYALICNETGWSYKENKENYRFDFNTIWQSYLKWQNAYFDLRAGSRWESAPLLKDLCKEMGKQFSFLFDLAEENSSKNLLIIPHDFLHRVPVHGALQSNRFLMNCFSCTYMTALHCFKTADETISFSANPPILIQYFDESKDKNKIDRTSSFMKKGKFDTDKSILSACTDDFCKAFEHDTSFFAIRCHGVADTVNPFSSGLILKNRLSLLELSKQPDENFSHKRIVIGACETDLIPPTDSPLDEHISIASILLGKGTAAIIGTMWEALDDRIIDMLRDKNLFDSFQNILKKKLKNQADPDSRLLYDNLCFKYYGRK